MRVSYLDFDWLNWLLNKLPMNQTSLMNPLSWGQKTQQTEYRFVVYGQSIIVI